MPVELMAAEQGLPHVTTLHLIAAAVEQGHVTTKGHVPIQVVPIHTAGPNHANHTYHSTKTAERLSLEVEGAAERLHVHHTPPRPKYSTCHLSTECRAFPDSMPHVTTLPLSLIASIGSA